MWVISQSNTLRTSTFLPSISAADLCVDADAKRLSDLDKHLFKVVDAKLQHPLFHRERSDFAGQRLDGNGQVADALGEKRDSITGRRWGQVNGRALLDD